MVATPGNAGIVVLTIERYLSQVTARLWCWASAERSSVQLASILAGAPLLLPSILAG